MKKRMVGAALTVLVIGVSLSGCAYGSSYDEDYAPPPAVEQPDSAKSYTLVKEIPYDSLSTQGIYKFCDSATLIYFSYGPSAGTQASTYDTAQAITAIPNSSECTTTSQ